MRVVSLVPSLTETLVECGVDVVGRTRFCIHPKDRVKDIAVVGGTKDAKWELIEALAPDLVVMDREENTREMADACPVPCFATHITSVESVAIELVRLAEAIDSAPLEELAGEWLTLTERKLPDFPGFDQLLGHVLDIGIPGPGIKRVEYIIWRDPWMKAGSGTFIESMLRRVGLGAMLVQTDERYPRIEDGDLPNPETCYLFSTEPYPFERYADELAAMGFNGAIVDGEFYSWFGIRSLRKMQEWLERSW